MATVSSIANNNYNVASLTQSGKISSDTSSSITSALASINTSSSSSAAYSLSDSLSSILNGSSSSSKKTNSAQSQLTTLWNAYTGNTSSSSNTGDVYSSLVKAYDSGQSYINSLVSSTSSLSSLMSSYDDAKNTFNSSVQMLADDLKSAAKTVKNNGYYVKGSTDEETAKNTAAVVKNVQNLVDSYNDASSYLSSNADLSNRISSLANSYQDNKYDSGTLNSIGISVDSSGKLSVDSEKLSKSLQENNSATSYVLDRLSDRATKKADLTNSQLSKLFPSVSSMMGASVEDTKKLYSGNVLSQTAQYNAYSNMLSMLA